MFSYRFFDEMLAICDSDILGKTFEDGEVRIEVKKSFYHHRSCGEEEALDLMKRARIVNACGKKIVNLMIENNLIERDKILLVKDLPHAQIVKI